jgi:hypothetical protein
MKQENIDAHDDKVAKWIKGGNLLYVWRDEDEGYPVSRYVVLFQTEYGYVMKFIRVFGSDKLGGLYDPSVDKSIAFDERMKEMGA